MRRVAHGHYEVNLGLFSAIPALCTLLISRTRPSLNLLYGRHRLGCPELSSTIVARDAISPSISIRFIDPKEQTTNNGRSRHGALDDFRELEKQSAVNCEPSPDSPLLIDQVKHRKNLNLWKELLDFRQRLYGAEGVKDIWHGIRKRSLQLPTKGDIADKLWTTFFTAAAADEELREDVWKYTRELFRETGHWWGGLYAALLSPLLSNNPQLAKLWASRLRNNNFTTKDSLKALIKPALSSLESIGAFKLLYIRHVDRNLYGTLIPALCDARMFQEALSFHYFLLRHGDLPHNTSEVDILAQNIALFSGQGTFDKFKQSLANIERPLPAPVVQSVTERRDETDSASSTEGDYFRRWTSRKPISDATAARAFATRAISVHFIITGLISFNLESLGMLGMRELAARCTNVAELSEHLHRLKHNGVAFQESIYIRLMQRLASERNQAMFESVLDSDQHPEVYDNRTMQLRLLEKYTKEQQWADAYRTLTVLTVMYQAPPEQAWNIVLRGFMIKQNWNAINEVLEDMLQQGITVTEQTIRKSTFMLLPSRAPGKLPAPSLVSQEIDSLTFLTRMWLKILETGGYVPTYTWHHLLVLYGIQGRLAELEDLSLKLAHYYSSEAHRVSKQSFMLETLDPMRRREKHQTLRRIQRFRPRGHQLSELLQIFTPAKQRAIIAWGFKTLGKNNTPRSLISATQLVPTSNSVTLSSPAQTSSVDRPLQWDRGLRLLQTLRARGLPVHYNLLRSVTRQRLQVLFHPDYNTNKPENRIARQRNSWSLVAMIRHINEVVQGNLLNLPERLLQDETQRGTRVLARLLLGPLKKARAPPLEKRTLRLGGAKAGRALMMETASRVEDFELDKD